MILPTQYTVIPILLLLILGIDVTLFTVTVIIPSIAITQSLTLNLIYIQTGDLDQAVSASTYAALVVAALWIFGFILRYARGKKLESLIPMPEYAKILVLFIGVLLIPLINLQYFVYYVYHNVVALFTQPIFSFLGAYGTTVVIPIAVVIYTLSSQYLLRAVEGMKASPFMVATLASSIIGALSLVTLTLSSALLNYVMQLTETTIAPFIAIALALLAILSIRELRRAFIELKPEAIVQIPTIFSVLMPYVYYVMPDLYTAMIMLLAGLTVALNAAAAIAGLGLGNRRILIAAAGLNSALLFVTTSMYPPSSVSQA